MTTERKATVERKTLETQVALILSLDGTGQADVRTGIGFLDHMLTLLAKHGFLDLTVRAQGPRQGVAQDDAHIFHCVVAVHIQVPLGAKEGIHRYGNCFLPMDETLAQVCLDCSGRPFLVFDAQIPKARLGAFDAEMAEEFFRAVAVHAGLTLHIRILYGANVHHQIEAIFKAFARALAEAVAPDPRVHGVMSSKGAL